MRQSLVCLHRSSPIGYVDGCSKMAVFKCDKYEYCSINTPQTFPYKLTLKGKVLEKIRSDSHRSCAICKANKEDD